MVDKYNYMDKGELRNRIHVLEDTLTMIIGDVDSCGYSHASTLHDVGNIKELAEKVLSGKDPHSALKEC